MKAIQLSYKPNFIEFTNFNRINEENLFNDVFSKLNKNSNIEVGKKVTGPSEDIYNCSIDGNPFLLLYDVDYGVSITSSDPETLKKLISFFNN